MESGERQWIMGSLEASNEDNTKTTRQFLEKEMICEVFVKASVSKEHLNKNERRLVGKTEKMDAERSCRMGWMGKWFLNLA